MKNIFKLAITTAALFFSLSASAELKVGYIEMDQLLQSQTSQDIGKKLENEFSSRASQLDQLKKLLNDKKTSLDKESKKLSETELRNRSKNVSDLAIELERKQREFNEDINLRKGEEMRKFQDQINKAIGVVAEADGFDLIIYNSVAFVSKKINITDKVISAIGK